MMMLKIGIDIYEKNKIKKNKRKKTKNLKKLMIEWSKKRIEKKNWTVEIIGTLINDVVDIQKL